MIDHLDDESKIHFSILRNYLDSLEIPFTVNPKLVRGLDYYNQTVFEWISNDLGSQGIFVVVADMMGLLKRWEATQLLLSVLQWA